VTKLWIIKSKPKNGCYKQALVTAKTKERAKILFLMRSEPEKYLNEEAARNAINDCIAIAILDID
tara:strand:- start:1580 stop:1774 length:195 start_codon:yes stop_codon:yes gene_type:complete